MGRCILHHLILKIIKLAKKVLKFKNVQKMEAAAWMDEENLKSKNSTNIGKHEQQKLQIEIPWKGWKNQFRHLKWDGKETNWSKILMNNQQEIHTTNLTQQRRFQT